VARAASFFLSQGVLTAALSAVIGRRGAPAHFPSGRQAFCRMGQAADGILPACPHPARRALAYAWPPSIEKAGTPTPRSFRRCRQGVTASSARVVTACVAPRRPCASLRTSTHCSGPPGKRSAQGAAVMGGGSFSGPILAAARGNGSALSSIPRGTAALEVSTGKRGLRTPAARREPTPALTRNRTAALRRTSETRRRLSIPVAQGVQCTLWPWLSTSYPARRSTRERSGPATPLTSGASKHCSGPQCKSVLLPTPKR